MYFPNEIRELFAIREATKSEIARQDSVRNFHQNCTINSLGEVVGKRALYDAYGICCDDETMLYVSKEHFGTVLESVNYANP